MNYYTYVDRENCISCAACGVAALNLFKYDVEDIAYACLDNNRGCESVPSNEIEHLKGDYIYQERDHQDIELGEHEYYYSDIIGCTVFKDDDTPIGRVINIFETGANDVWIVKGEKEYLIPYIEDVVKDIDIETKTIKITPMEGLLD